jgi:bacterioferritin
MSEIITRDQPMDSDIMPYRRPEPYAIPVNLEKNIKQGNLLSLAYAGKNSEFTAISQYVVHHITCSDTNSDISHDILQIGVVEMFHLDMLGSCLKQLGTSVNLGVHNGCATQFWTAGYIKYGKNLRERLLLDIQGEKDCIAQYRYIIQNIHNPAIERLLERIIGDEEVHIDIFEKMLTQINS